MDGDSGYDLSDPKSPDYHDRMSDVYDNRDKTGNAERYVLERCVIDDGSGVLAEHRIGHSGVNEIIVILRSPMKSWTFKNKREFKKFLKMLMRYDERL